MKNPAHPIYSDGAMQIYVNDHGGDLADYNERMKRMNVNSTLIYFYRASEYGFACNVELNAWGRDKSITAFEKTGLNVVFDKDEREYVIQNTKDRFNFVLKYGGYCDK